MKRMITNEYGEQVIVMNRSDRGPLSEKEKEMISHIGDFDDEYDEDCPPMSEEMAKQMELDIKAVKAQGYYLKKPVSV